MYKVLISMEPKVQDSLVKLGDRRTYVPFAIKSYKNLIKELYACGEDEALNTLNQLNQVVWLFKELEKLEPQEGGGKNSYRDVFDHILSILPILKQKFNERKTLHLQKEEDWIRELELKSLKYPW